MIQGGGLANIGDVVKFTFRGSATGNGNALSLRVAAAGVWDTAAGFFLPSMVTPQEWRIDAEIRRTTATDLEVYATLTLDEGPGFVIASYGIGAPFIKGCPIATDLEIKTTLTRGPFGGAAVSYRYTDYQFVRKA